MGPGATSPGHPGVMAPCGHGVRAAPGHPGPQLRSEGTCPVEHRLPPKGNAMKTRRIGTRGFRTIRGKPASKNTRIKEAERHLNEAAARYNEFATVIKALIVAAPTGEL